MVTKRISLSVGKRLSYGFAVIGILLSVGIFGLATAGSPETKVSTPVRILLTDDTPDATLSVRRTAPDQRNLNRLYNNDLRPKKTEPKKVVEIEVKPAPPAKIVTPETLNPKHDVPETVEQVKEIPLTKSANNGLDSILTTLTLPKFDLFGDIESALQAIDNDLSSTTNRADTNSRTNSHKSKLKRTYSNHNAVDQASTGLPAMPSIDTLLPRIELSKFDVLGDIEAAFDAIEDELMGATNSSANNSPRNNHQSKLKQTNSKRNAVDQASTGLPAIPSLDTLLPKIELSKFDVLGDIEAAFDAIEDELMGATNSSANNSPRNNHQSKLKQTNSKRNAVDQASTGLPAIPSLDTLLPRIELPQVDVFGEIESAFTSIGNELSSAATSAASTNSSRDDSKMKHLGNFTPRQTSKVTSAPVHWPTIGSLDGIQFPNIELADINLFFGTSSTPLVDENGEIPTAVLEKLQEQTKEPVKDAVEAKQSEMSVKERRGIFALLGLDDLAIPEFNNPFAVGTGIKETEQHVEPVETKNIDLTLDQRDLEPDETIADELPNLNTDRPDVPGVKQIPTLAPKHVPEAPNTVDELDKSASRMSPYRTLVNPDSFLPQRTAIPVSVRISDSPVR